MFKCACLMLSTGGVTPPLPGGDAEAGAAGRNGKRMTMDEARGYLEEVGRHAQRLVDHRVEFSGGEPFDDYEGLLSLVIQAGRLKLIPTVVTFGGWAVDVALTRRRLVELITAGMKRLVLDADPDSPGRFALEPALTMLNCVRETNLSVDIICHATVEHAMMPELLRLELLSSSYSSFWVAPPKSSKLTPAEMEPFFTIRGFPPAMACSTHLALTILPGGGVYPCGQSTALPALRLGNLAEESLEAILDRAQHCFWWQQLRRKGPGYCEPYLRAAGLADRVESGRYLNRCHFCVRVFGDEVLAAASQGHQERSDELSIAGPHYH